MCPYEKSHIILKSRIQYHLIKCAKNHPHIKLERCPFDVTHHLRPDEKAAHIVSCPSRASFDEYKFTIQNGMKREEPAVERATPPEIASEESWDEINEPTYDPQKYARQAPVLRTCPLSTKSERRAFRDEERQRLGQMKKN